MHASRLVAAAAGVVLLALAGCSGDAEPVAQESLVDASGSSSGVPDDDASVADSPSEDAEPVDEQSGGYDEQQLLAAMKAAVAENQSTHMVMEIAGDGQTMTGEGDVSYAGDSTAMQLEMQSPQLGQGTIEMRMVDGTIFMSMPPMTPEGKFLAFDLTDANSPFGDLGGVTQGDPMQTFKAFEEGLEKAEYVGRDDVDGEEMDHYVLTVDGSAVADAQGNPAGGDLPETLTYDLWLDEDDLMRRVQYSMGGGGVTITMSDWGEPVDVQAPPKSALVELPGSMG